MLVGCICWKRQSYIMLGTRNQFKFFMVMNASLPCIMWHCCLTVSVVCIEMVNCNVEFYSVCAY